MDNESFKKYPVFANLTNDIVELIKNLEKDLKKILGDKNIKSQDFKKGSLFSKVGSLWPFKYFSKQNPSLKEYSNYKEKVDKIIEEILVENLGKVITENYEFISPTINKFKLDFRNIINKYANELENSLSANTKSTYSPQAKQMVVQDDAEFAQDNTEENDDDNSAHNLSDLEIQEIHLEKNNIIEKINNLELNESFKPNATHIKDGDIINNFIVDFLNWFIKNNIDIKKEELIKNKLKNIGYNPEESFYRKILILADEDEDLADSFILRIKYKKLIYKKSDKLEYFLNIIENIFKNEQIDNDDKKYFLELIISSNDLLEELKNISEKNQIQENDESDEIILNLATDRDLHKKFVEKILENKEYKKLINI